MRVAGEPVGEAVDPRRVGADHLVPGGRCPGLVADRPRRVARRSLRLTGAPIDGDCTHRALVGSSPGQPARTWTCSRDGANDVLRPGFREPRFARTTRASAHDEPGPLRSHHGACQVDAASTPGRPPSAGTCRPAGPTPRTSSPRTRSHHRPGQGRRAGLRPRTARRGRGPAPARRRHRRARRRRDRHRRRGRVDLAAARHAPRRRADHHRRRARAPAGGARDLHRGRHRVQPGPADLRPRPGRAPPPDRRRLRPGRLRRRQDRVRRATSSRRCGCCAPAGSSRSTTRSGTTGSPTRPSATETTTAIRELGQAVRDDERLISARCCPSATGCSSPSSAPTEARRSPSRTRRSPSRR